MTICEILIFYFLLLFHNLVSGTRQNVFSRILQISLISTLLNSRWAKFHSHHQICKETYFQFYFSPPKTLKQGFYPIFTSFVSICSSALAGASKAAVDVTFTNIVVSIHPIGIAAKKMSNFISLK